MVQATDSKIQAYQILVLHFDVDQLLEYCSVLVSNDSSLHDYFYQTLFYMLRFPLAKEFVKAVPLAQHSLIFT